MFSGVYLPDVIRCLCRYVVESRERENLWVLIISTATAVRIARCTTASYELITPRSSRIFTCAVTRLCIKLALILSLL